MLGTLNYADLSRLVAEHAASGRPLPAGFEALSLCMLFVFCLKAAVFPLWFWLPDTYHTMPAPIGALFAALLSKVGVYAVLRLYPMTFASPLLDGLDVVTAALPLLAGLTMLVAIVAACAAHDIRRIVAMVLISHVGYLIFGVSLMRSEAFAGTLHYMAQEMLVIAGLFMAAGVVGSRAGTTDIRELGGLYARMPVLSSMVFVLLMSLVGIPPLSGFFGKLVLIREGLAAGEFVLTGILVTTAGLTIVAVGRLWARVFWSPAAGSGVALPPGAVAGPSPAPVAAYAGIGVLTLASVGVGLAAEPTYSFAQRSTAELAEPRTYVTTVLNPPFADEGAADDPFSRAERRRYPSTRALHGAPEADGSTGRDRDRDGGAPTPTTRTPGTTEHGV